MVLFSSEACRDGPNHKPECKVRGEKMEKKKHFHELKTFHNENNDHEDADVGVADVCSHGAEGYNQAISKGTVGKISF